MFPVVYGAYSPYILQVSRDAQYLAIVDFLPQLALKSLWDPNTVMYSKPSNTLRLSRAVPPAFIPIDRKSKFFLEYAPIHPKSQAVPDLMKG